MRTTINDIHHWYWQYFSIGTTDITVPKLISKLKKGGFDDDVQAHVAAFDHQALHAAEIMFIHPRTEEEMVFSSDLPDDFAALLDVL